MCGLLVRRWLIPPKDLGLRELSSLWRSKADKTYHIRLVNC